MDIDTNEIDLWMARQPQVGEEIQISVIIPAYNERWRLPPTLLDTIDYLDKEIPSYEIIVVDDGSSDETASVVRKFERVRDKIRLISLPKNMGKGHAVRLGALNAKGREILFADADGSTPIMELERLRSQLRNGADVAIGSRALHSEDVTLQTKMHRKFLGRAFNFFVNTILLPGICDTQCGFKIFKYNAAQFLFRSQKMDRFSFDIELLYMARRCNLTISEVAVNWEHVSGSKVNLVLDSIKMFRDIFRIKVRHRNLTHDDYMKFLQDQVEKTG